jgi:SAM-dependent methyltransferase
VAQAAKYDPPSYWGNLVGQKFDLRGVAYPDLSLAFHEYLYRAMADSVERGLDRWGLGPEQLRDAQVLDVGSGVGFWIDFWLARGARSISGIDLTQASAERLAERFPQLSFSRGDIADPRPEWDGRFDVISAMSIVHHIPSQERWQAAVVNLGRMLKPGGRLLLMDPILTHPWWGKEIEASDNGRARSLDEHRAALAQTGTSVEFVLPTSVLLSNPMDASSPARFRVAQAWWSAMHRLARRPALMRAAGPPIYAADRWLSRRGLMPSSKILFCRRAAA